MTDTSIIHIAVMTMVICAKVAGPILIIALVVGLGISLIQSVTQIQEVTLTFVPKLVAVAFVIVLLGRWMLGQMVSFFNELFDLIPQLIAH